MTLNESIVEEAALGWFQELGYTVLLGPQLAPGEQTAERETFSDVVLVGRLRQAIRQLNPAIPDDARDEALRKLLRLATPSLLQTKVPASPASAAIPVHSNVGLLSLHGLQGEETLDDLVEPLDLGALPNPKELKAVLPDNLGLSADVGVRPKRRAVVKFVVLNCKPE
jgi:hypothetical protein